MADDNVLSARSEQDPLDNLLHLALQIILARLENNDIPEAVPAALQENVQFQHLLAYLTQYAADRNSAIKSIKNEVKAVQEQLDQREAELAQVNSKLSKERDDHENASQREQLYRQAIEGSGAAPYVQKYGDGSFDFMSENVKQITGYSPEEMNSYVWDSIVQETVLVGEGGKYAFKEAIDLIRSGKLKDWQWKCDYRIRTKDGQERWVTDTAVDIYENGVSYGSIGILQDNTDRKAAEVKLRKHSDQLTALDRVSQAMAEINLDYPAAMEAAVKLVSETMGDLAVIHLFSTEPRQLHLSTFHHPDPIILVGMQQYFGSLPQEKQDEILNQVLQNGQPQFIPLVSSESIPVPTAPEYLAFIKVFGIHSLVVVPLRAEGRMLGYLASVRDQKHPDPYTPDDQIFIQELANRIGLAIANAQLYKDSLRRLNYVQTLREIDLAISANFDTRLILNFALDRAASVLKVDAANVLLFNPFSQTLTYAASRGFYTSALQHTHLRLGESYTGMAAASREMVKATDFSNFIEKSPQFAGENFVVYFGAPLLVKGAVKGVLEVFHRSPFNPDDEWVEFLETLARQIAIALENITLFNDLQNTNAELVLAYDATIEGWSRALDFRDKETEGHSQRVTEMTEQLALASGVDEAEIVHIHRGALLHDIGKMGIPDSILLKKGALNAKDWEVMRQHPRYAYEMLSPISYLKAALDIPYCHHERWNGSGYPRGLKGEQIPLAARIFAISDVWDALRSDRSYRLAWTASKAYRYIISRSGIDFDPKLVNLFKQMVQV